ncbi:MAG: hypothetical protein HY777_02520 [Betaproteobacteria bacterium]|nr:hypothetical protein [Betaproteobacteria bacterium]
MGGSAYRRTGAPNNSAPCVFSRALLARCVQCELAERHALAERETVFCTIPTARINCGTLAALLYERATFALRLPRAGGGSLPHAKAVKLYCGGLLALQQTLSAPDADVHRMIRQHHGQGASLADLPWEEIVAGAVRWQPRKRHPPPPASPLPPAI